MAKDVRSTLRDTADGADAEIAQFFKDALKAEQNVKIKCQCGRWAEGPHADWRARLAAIQALLEQGYGKPAAAQDGPAVNLDQDPEKATPEQRAAIRQHIDRLLQAATQQPNPPFSELSGD